MYACAGESRPNKSNTDVHSKRLWRSQAAFQFASFGLFFVWLNLLVLLKSEHMCFLLILNGWCLVWFSFISYCYGQLIVRWTVLCVTIEIKPADRLTGTKSIDLYQCWKLCTSFETNIKSHAMKCFRTDSNSNFGTFYNCREHVNRTRTSLLCVCLSSLPMYLHASYILICQFLVLSLLLSSLSNLVFMTVKIRYGQ